MQKYPKNQVKCDETRLRFSVENDWRETRDIKRRSDSAPQKIKTTCDAQPSHMTSEPLADFELKIGRIGQLALLRCGCRARWIDQRVNYGRVKSLSSNFWLFFFLK